MKKLLFLLAGTAMIGFSGCDKKESDGSDIVEPTVSRSEMITATNWVMVSALQTQNGQTENLFEAQPVTSQDDVFNFTKQGEVVREEGATKEDNNPDVVDKGSYALINSDKELQVDMKTLPMKDEIVELSRAKLVLRNFDGLSETITTFQAE